MISWWSSNRSNKKFATIQDLQEVVEAVKNLKGQMVDMQAVLEVEQQKFAQQDELNRQVERLDFKMNDVMLKADTFGKSMEKLMDTSAASSMLASMDVDSNPEVISAQERAAHSQQVADFSERVDRLENILKPSIINAQIKNMMDMKTSLPAVSTPADVEMEEPPIQEQAKDSAQAIGSGTATDSGSATDSGKPTDSEEPTIPEGQQIKVEKNDALHLVLRVHDHDVGQQWCVCMASTSNNRVSAH